MDVMLDHRIIRIFTVAWIAIALTGCSDLRYNPELSISEDHTEKIDQVVERLYENGQFSGVVFVSVKGKVIYNKAVGYANIEDSLLNTSDTKFRIASFSKPFTAMLILQLMEEGKISLDGKLIQYLPEFSKKQGGEDITIHHLLTHTAGITGESRIPDLIDIEKEYYTRERLLELIMEKDLVFKPGEGREYSNFGFALLGMVIEKASGKSYDEILQEKICKPAGMENTLADITAKTIEKRATGYTYDYFNGLEPASFLDMSFCLGAGQLLSTVEDLYLFDKALYTNKLLSEESKKLFFNDYGWLPVRYPYGTGLKRIYSHNLEGSINGFQSHTQRVDKDTVLIVALRNVKEQVYENQIVIKWPSALASPVLSILYNEEYILPGKSAAFTIFKTLINSGQHAAEDEYARIMNEPEERYYFNDDEFKFFLEELAARNMDKQFNEYQVIWTSFEK